MFFVADVVAVVAVVCHVHKSNCCCCCRRFCAVLFPPNSRALGRRVITTMPLLHPIQWWQGRPLAVPAEWDPHTPVYLAVLAHKQRGKTLPIPLWCVPHYHPVRIVQPWNGVAVDPSQRQWWCSRDCITWGVCPQPQPWHFWLQALSFQKDQGV